MQHPFSRTQILYGSEAMKKLASSRVAVFGIGGVGGYVCEALCRSGVGHFDLIDRDTVSLTNLNRQIIATRSTIGREKTEVMKERMLDINPECDIRVHACFYLPQNAGDFPFEEYDYVVDAVDTVTAKLDIIDRAVRLNIPVISAMGAGNKTDPGRFQIADISQTKVCPLARVMRKELKKRNIQHLKVVYSDEPPYAPLQEEIDSAAELFELDPGRRSLPGSTAFSPSVAGLLIAAEVVNDLTKEVFRIHE